eukprot:jgi/Mesvir1/25766/Mv01942-RA.1
MSKARNEIAIDLFGNEPPSVDGVSRYRHWQLGSWQPVAIAPEGRREDCISVHVCDRDMTCGTRNNQLPARATELPGPDKESSGDKRLALKKKTEEPVNRPPFSNVSRVGADKRFLGHSSCRSRAAPTAVYSPSTGAGPLPPLTKEASRDNQLSFEIQAGEFKQELEKISRVAGSSGKAGMPSILTHFHMSASPAGEVAAGPAMGIDGIGAASSEDRPRVIIRAGDGQVSMLTSFPVASVSSFGVATVPAAPLLSLVKPMVATARMQVTCDGRAGTAAITGGGSRFTLRGEPAGNYPDLPSWDSAREVRLPWPELLWALQRTRHAAAKERDGRPMLASICLQLGQGGGARFVATDSSRLATVTVPVSHDSDPPTRSNYVLSMRFVQEVTKVLGDVQKEIQIEEKERERELQVKAKKGGAAAATPAAAAATSAPAPPPRPLRLSRYTCGRRGSRRSFPTGTASRMMFPYRRVALTSQCVRGRVRQHLVNLSTFRVCIDERDVAQNVMVACGSTMVTSVNVAANNYPDIDGLLQHDCDFHMRLNKGGLEASLKQLLPFVDGGGMAGRIGSSVVFSYESGVLSLAARSDLIGEGMTTLPVEESSSTREAPSSWKMSFNPYFFLDVLTNATGFVDFGLVQPTGPAILRDEGDRQSMFLIMPMGISS